MGYRLGVDLGTTFTAAAIGNGQPPAMLGLGNRALQIPSVLFLQDDGQFLVGEAAERRGFIDPSRVVREFKRRMGDPVPILVAGTPFSPQALTARLLAWVVAAATERQGGPPDEVVLTFPANWGDYKRELLDQVIAMADIGPARTCPEPQAAAIQYSVKARLDPGARVAVYDLGGGTFDVCVLEKTPDGFTILGSPGGVEHLGGVDFDEAVFQHVVNALGPALEDLDLNDIAVKTALTRLRRDCVEAKEALSADVDTVIPVALPGRNTTVRLTRAELENLIGPSLQDTVSATTRALRAADTTGGELSAIVLVGGSSRIPLVSHLLQSTFATTTALDTHPKHDVALGAVQFGTSGASPAGASSSGASAVTVGESPVHREAHDPRRAREERARRDAAVMREVLAPPEPPAPSPATGPSAGAQTQPGTPQPQVKPGPTQPQVKPGPTQPQPRPPVAQPPGPADDRPGLAGTPGPVGTGAPGGPAGGSGERPVGVWWRRRWVAIPAAAVAIATVVVGAAIALRDDPGNSGAANQASSTPNQGSASQIQPSASAPTKTAARRPGAPGLYDMAVSSDGSRIYVSNRELSTLSVVDTSTGELVVRPIAVGDEPLGVGIDRSGTRAYAVNGTLGTVQVIDTATLKKVGAPIRVGKQPLAIVPDSTANRAYVTNRGSSSISVVDTATNKTTETIAVGIRPLQVLLSPERGRAYVTNHGSSTVSVIDTGTNRTVGEPIRVAAQPHSLALLPGGGTLYVTHIDSAVVDVIDTATGSVAGQSITLPIHAWDVAISGDGRWLYASLTDAGQIAIVDTATRKVQPTRITVGKNPTDLTVSADGRRVYVANNGSGTISVIDTTSNRLVDTIPVPK